MARPAWTAQCTNRKLIGELLPVRRRESHKGDYGRVLLLCGSEGLTGAARLAGKGQRSARAAALCISACRRKSIRSSPQARGARSSFRSRADEAGRLCMAALPCDYSAASRNGRCAARPRSWPLGGADAAGAGSSFHLPCAARSGRGRHKRRCAAYRCVARMCLSGRAHAA